MTRKGYRQYAEDAVVRHEFLPQDQGAASALLEQIDKGIRLKARRTPIAGDVLREAVTSLLKLVVRSETGAVFVLDAEGHLAWIQVCALRRRTCAPARYPRLLVNAAMNTRPPLDPDKPRRVNSTAVRFRIESVIDYVADAPNLGRRLSRPPILEGYSLPQEELEGAQTLGIALLEARLSGVDGLTSAGLPLSLVHVLLDLGSILALGRKAYIIVLDHDHIADVTDPRALGRVTLSARSLEEPSAVSLRMRQRAENTVASARQLPPRPDRLRRRGLNADKKVAKKTAKQADG